MAVKKTQMYRRNLDGTETNLNPLTEAQYVSMGNGQTVQEVLSDRDSDKYTPVIINSSSTFKVGQGDNVDLSSSMKEGAYDSCVLKGKTMVNCIQEPSSKDIVLPYDFADGQYVTINDTKESGALGVELKGQTLINEALIDYMSPKNYASVNGNTLTLDLSKQYSLVELTKDNPLLIPNEIYTCVLYDVTGDTTNINFSIQNASSTKLHLKDVGYKFKFTMGVGNNLTNRLCYIENLVATSGTVSLKMVLLKGDYTNVDIPYFTGMTSCKMPTLSTCGNNIIKNSSDVYVFENYDDTNRLSTATKLSLDANYKQMLRGKEVTISVDAVGENLAPLAVSGSGYNYYGVDINVVFEDGTNQWLSLTKGNGIPANGSFNGRYYKTLTVQDKSIKQVATCQLFCRTTVGRLTLTNVQLEIRNANSNYELYKSSILSLPDDLELRGIGDVKDTLDCMTGEKVERIGEIVLDGSEDERWTLHQIESYTTHTRFGFSLRDNSKPLGITHTELKCDRFAWINSDIETEHTKIDGRNARTIFIYIQNSRLTSQSIGGFKQWLQSNPITIQYQLETPVITKINLSSTLKSWNTTTHIYSEIPENSLYPILSHSNPSYPVILKPSTKYSIVANSYSNSHTNSAINFNLGGATTSTTVGNRVTTITTPSTLTSEELVMRGRGNKLNNVMIIEGNVVGDEPYFEGICDVKSPILSNIGKNLVDSSKIRKWMDKDTHFEYPDYIRVEPNTWYITNLEMGCWDYYNINKEHIGQKYTNLAYPNIPSYLTPNDCYYLKMRCWGGNTDTSKGLEYYQKYFALYEEMSNQPHEPHKSNTTTFEQKDGKTIVLRSLPSGVCDTLNVETGEYVQRIGEVNTKSLQTAVNLSIGTEANVVFVNGINGKFIGWNECTVASDKLQWVDRADINWSKSSSINGIVVEPSGGFWIIVDKTIEAKEQANEFLVNLDATIQYELETPIVSTIDVQGYPYAYANGHVQLSSGHSGQSLTPTVEYSLSANKTGQIDNNTRQVVRQQKQLDDFEAMMLTQMVQSAYDKAILQFDYEMQMMSLGGE